MSAINISVPGVPFTNLASTDTIALLRARSSSGLTQGENVVVDGDAALGDGGGGLYVWDALSTADDTGDAVIKPTDRTALQAGRWLAIGGGNGGGGGGGDISDFDGGIDEFSDGQDFSGGIDG